MTSWILLRFRNKKQQQQRERKRSRVRGRETAHLIELLCRKFLSLPLLENWSTKGAWLISVSACCHILRHGHPFPLPPPQHTTLTARREKMRFSIEAREEKTAAEVAMATQGEGNGSGGAGGSDFFCFIVSPGNIQFSIFWLAKTKGERNLLSAWEKSIQLFCYSLCQLQTWLCFGAMNNEETERVNLQQGQLCNSRCSVQLID